MGRNTLKLDVSGFENYLKKLDDLGGNVRQIVEQAVEKSAQRIQTDTHLALSKQFLPAQGKYWTGTTSKAVISNHKTVWEGSTAYVPVGFDFSKPGAGGYLITGTPRMRPDKELNKIYKQKRYITEIQKEMEQMVMDKIIDKMVGG